MAVANEIPERFLWCRDVGHRWDAHDAILTQNNVTRRREIHRKLRCEHCTATRIDALSTNGEVLRRWYVYPHGYLLNQQGNLTSADRAMIRRINTDHSFTFTKQASA